MITSLSLLDTTSKKNFNIVVIVQLEDVIIQHNICLYIYTMNVSVLFWYRVSSLCTCVAP